MRNAALALAALFIAATAADAQTITLRSYRDATIRGGAYANTNYGDKNILETRASDDGDYLRRAVVMFDTASVLSSSAQIGSAKLVLTVKSGNAESRRLTACALPVSFNEPTVTWKRRSSSTYWSHAGGDFIQSDCSQTTVTATASSKVTFDVTEQVQKAVKGTYGTRYARFVVLDAGANSRDSYKQYYSNNESNTGVRPTLLVGTGTTTSTAPSGSVVTEPSGSTLRVLQWNIHHGGFGTDGKYDTNRVATWIVKMDPDVVLINEIEKYTSWGNQNQPEVYKNLLQSKTGKTWYYVFAQEYGAWSSNGKGNIIYSTVPFKFTDRHELVHNGDRSIAEAAIEWNGRTITLMSTHLDPDSQSLRLTQATEVSTWAAAEPENRIIAGDMNAWPDQSSIAYFNKYYKDSWAVAVANGTAKAFSGNDGETKKGRIDYIFYSRNAGNLSVASSRVYDTRDANGVMPSDHRPVLTTFNVR